MASAATFGPYSGTVLDAQTNRPVEGASVLIYWVNSVPTMMGASSKMIDLRLVYTDEKGEYGIPVFIAKTEPTGILEATIVVIYQPGYQAYIKTIRHGITHEKPDPEFREHNNIVKCKRIPPNFDHKKHYEEIERALWGIDEYRSDTTLPEHAAIDEAEWKKMVAFDKRVVPYKRELLRRAEWEERRGSDQ